MPPASLRISIRGSAPKGGSDQHSGRRSGAREGSAREADAALFLLGDRRQQPPRRSFLAQVLQRRRNHDTFQVTRIDAGKRPDLIERFRVESLPSLLVVDDRRVQARLTRPRGCDQIKEILTPWLR